MERGYINIKENDDNQFIVEAKLVNCTLWISEHEMADLFNVFVSAISNNLRSIFKSRVLREEKVTYTHKFEHKGRQCETILYNLEALIFVSYRIASFEVQAFREWMMGALSEYTRMKAQKEKKVLITYNLSSKLPGITLN